MELIPIVVQTLIRKVRIICHPSDPSLLLRRPLTPPVCLCFLAAISRPRFRSSESGKALPSPRLVSIVVHADVSHLHGRYTLMLMQYGQFLDHDITLTPINKVIGPSQLLLNDKD